MHRLLILLAFSLLTPLAMKGQHLMGWEEFLQQFIEDDEPTEDDDLTTYIEQLEHCHLHPIDVNTATPQQLRTLPLLSELQIEQLIRYTDLHGSMHSIAELILIPSISYRERQYLPLFLTITRDTPATNQLPSATSEIGDTLSSRHQMFQSRYPGLSTKKVKSEVLFRTDIPLYHRRGHLLHTQSGGGYSGSPLYNKLVARVEAPHIQVGLQAERDPGEKGIDSYGGYLYLHDINLSRQLPITNYKSTHSSVMLGDYKVSFGQGLVLNQGFSMGKTYTGTRRSHGLRPHRGTDEFNFMRGAGITLTFHNLTTTLFYSHRRWDATLSPLSNSSNLSGPSQPSPEQPLREVKTIVRDGYHRTAGEAAKKGILATDAAGANIAWNHQGFHLGTTGYYLHTAMPLNPGNDPYRQIYPRGSHFGALSLDYAYEAYRLHLFGETAFKPFNTTEQAFLVNGQNVSGKYGVGKKGAWATLNGVNWRPSQRYTLSVLQRFYHHHYHSFFSSAISECGGWQAGGVQNETGATLRVDATPWDGVEMASYIDLFYNPWPRYGLTSSSKGWDGMIETSCNITRHNTIKFRYNAKQKETATFNSETASSNIQVPFPSAEAQSYSTETPTHHRFRLQWLYSPVDQWHVTTTTMLNCLKKSHGEALGCTTKYQSHSRTWHASASLLYFHTTDYTCRIYLYEPNVGEMMYVPSFSGHGLRASGLIQASFLHQHVSLELKYGFTCYFDRKIQGSGMQTIYSNVKNDITLQTRIKI